MRIFGVVNASPDSLHEQSIVRTVEEAKARIDWLLSAGADGIDVGGQGSTAAASVVDGEAEWDRVCEVLGVAVEATDLVSIDTWRPELMRRALEAGVGVLNSADGMATAEAWEVAAEHRPLVVVPFMNGPNPHELAHVEGDPLDAMDEFFSARLAWADRFGLRDRCLLDPGTGFGPHGWDWADRYEYQKHVYRGLGRLRRFDRPLYLPLPWKETDQHDELLEIALAAEPEYGRVHHPDKVRRVEALVRAGGGRR